MSDAGFEGTTGTIRNRIKGHRRVRAGDLVPHELNYRHHPAAQRTALDALYHEIGFARSLLAYELPDARLKLIDGHLRRDMDPGMLVDVEILDVDEQEARALLLSIDPLAELAMVQEQLHQRLQELTPTADADLQALWQETRQALEAAEEENSVKKQASEAELGQQFFVLIPCQNEDEQKQLLQRFQAEGLPCRAVLG